MLLSLALACAPHQLPGTAPDEGKEQALLAEAVSAHWEGWRWRNPAAAGAFIEQPAERLIYVGWLEEELEDYKLLDLQILQIELLPELPREHPRRAEGWLREATVHLRREGIPQDTQVMESEKLDQRWYRSMEGWWLEWEPPPPG